MKTLNNPADLQTILRRVGELKADDAGLWGSMSVQQMVCHLSDSYQVALGKKPARMASGFWQRTLLKWIALHGPMAWPKGVRTLPEVEQGKGGTPPGDFALDRVALQGTVEVFCGSLPSPSVPHAIFGNMTAADWMRWGWLHADHHLRQFGR